MNINKIIYYEINSIKKDLFYIFYKNKLNQYIDILKNNYSINKRIIYNWYAFYYYDKIKKLKKKNIKSLFSYNSKELFIIDEILYPHLLNLYSYEKTHDIINDFINNANYIIFFCELFENNNLKTYGNDKYNIHFSNILFKKSIMNIFCNYNNIEYLKNINIIDNSIYFPPIGYNKTYNYRLNNNNYEFDFIFYGSINKNIIPYRSNLLSKLTNYSIKKNYKFKIFNMTLNDNNKKNILSKTKIIIHFNSFKNLNTTPWAKISELILYKKFFLFEYSNDQKKLKEILDIDLLENTFKSEEELYNKIDYYLKNKDKQNKICNYLYKKFINNFNLEKLFNNIL